MSLKNFSQVEPVVLTSIITAAIALIVSFGVEVTAEQTGAILAFVSIVGGLITRSKTYSAPVLDALAAQEEVKKANL